MYQLTPQNTEEDENAYLIIDKKNSNIVLKHGDKQKTQYIVNSGTVSYTINESAEGIDITIVTKKENIWSGKIASKKGSLKRLAGKTFENMQRNELNDHSISVPAYR